MADAETIAFYTAHADEYGKAWGERASPALKDFIAALPVGAHVLDLGCGAGHASAHMAAAALHPDPVDASPGMVRAAAAKGLPARHMRFDQLRACGAYDGVWANFSLTHAAPKDLSRHLGAIAQALRPGGILHIGMKTGNGPYRDRLGRLYHLIEAEDLIGLLETAGLHVTDCREGLDIGFDNAESAFAIIRAVKHG